MKTNLKFEAMEPGTDFNAAESAVRKLAEEEFMRDYPAGENNDRQYREHVRRHAREVVELWFAVQPLYASINVRSDINQDEIRDEWFNGSITVYGPTRMLDYDATRAAERNGQRDGKNIYKIVPGYVNASSWSAGVHGSDARWVRQEMLHRLRMMELAVTLLNQRNQLCLEFEHIDSPFEKSHELDRRMAELRREKEKADAVRTELMEAIRAALRANGDMSAKSLARVTCAKLTAVESCLQTLMLSKDVLLVGKSELYRAQLPLPLTEAK